MKINGNDNNGSKIYTTTNSNEPNSNREFTFSQKIKLAITQPEKKWYLQTWFLCLLFLFWFMVIPLILGIIFIVKHYINNYKRNLKYGEFDEIEKKINELTQQLNQQQINMQIQLNNLNDTRNKGIDSKNKEIDSKNKEIAKILQRIEALKTEKNNLENEIRDFNQELIIRYTDVSDYSNISSQEIKNKLNMLKLDVNSLIKNNKAIDVTVSIDNTNKNAINSNIQQLLRSFNYECDSIIQKLTIKNIDSSRTKFERSFNTLNKLYLVDNVQITKKYYEYKLQELTLNYVYIQQLENEKDQQRAIKEQLIEEEKVRKEIEREKAKIEKEETQFKNEISKLMKYMHKSSLDVEKQLYLDKIKDLENKLKLLEKDKENVFQREQNTRSGFVYIISNIGSFGENIYKIGMTRRLEPLDRIKELGNASVPFQFDVHALIFSEDAPGLENVLHQTFKENQVNKLNPRKEFYNIDLNKIKDVVLNNYNNTVNFTDYAEAYEFRESQKLKDN